MDFGTLYQLRTLINRRNVVSDVTKDMTACEEFMELITNAYVISAATHIGEVCNVKELASKIMSSDNQVAAVTSIAKTLCSKMVNLHTTAADTMEPTDSSLDRVLEYSKEVLSLGLLLMEFKDAIREGDGLRVLRCWKYFFLFFRATNHKNYCIEALHFLMQYYYLLPRRYAEQMLWGRFVNTRGGLGNNISADLHMEHLNRLLKDMVSHLGANKTPCAILRASKALGILNTNTILET